MDILYGTFTCTIHVQIALPTFTYCNSGRPTAVVLHAYCFIITNPIGEKTITEDYDVLFNIIFLTMSLESNQLSTFPQQ